MSALGLRDKVREDMVRDVLGAEWRADHPLEIGGLIGQMFGKIRRGEDPQATMGEIDGRIRALALVNDAVRDMTGGN